MIASTTQTGTLGALNADLTVTCPKDQKVTFAVSGTFTATLTFEGTIDGTNWTTIAAQNVQALGTATVVTTATAAGTFVVDATVFQAVRLKATAYTSGSASVVARKARNFWVPRV